MLQFLGGFESVTIRRYDAKLLTISPQKLTLGSIYTPLYRLEQKGFVESYLGNPSHKRGGKSKRFYRVTEEGLKALKEIKILQEKSWVGLPANILDKI